MDDNELAGTQRPGQGAPAEVRSRPVRVPSGPIWRKSSFSGYNGNCVEVAALGPGRVGVRDSKGGADGPVLQFTRDEWAGFLATVPR